MLVLGLRNIDEAVGHTFLPQNTMVNIGETFAEHSITDRQMLMLAMHRLVLQLLAAMGEAVQTAMRNPRSGDREMVTVTVEAEEDDDTMWMQLPPVNDGWPLLQSFMEAMDQQIKISQRCMAEWLLDWLSHRCTDERQGYLLGHMGGRTVDLTAALVTYSGNQCSDEWAQCTDDEFRWCMTWAQKLQRHLGLHPGSRQARGLAPRRAPVMLTPAPIPDALLVPPAQTLHGDLPASQLDRAVEVESSEREHSQVERDQAVVDYSAGLHTPTSQQPVHKNRAVMLELSSSSSTDSPARVVRLPVPATGEITFNLRVWTETEEDQDGIATVMVGDRPAGSGGAHGGGVLEPNVDLATPAVPATVGPELVHQLAAMQPNDEGAIVSRYGWDVLRDVQVCRALAREGTQLDESFRSEDDSPAAVNPVSLPGGTGGELVPTRNVSGVLPRPSQEENASSGASIFDQGDPAEG